MSADAATRDVVAVVGGGPAGLHLAIRLAATHQVSVFDQFAPGGELLSLGLVNGPDGVETPGPDLATDLLERVMELGASIEFDEVTELRPDGDGWVVVSDAGELRAAHVVLATGAAHGEAPFPGGDELLGRGVSYCAGCDGPMYGGRTVAVVGDGPYMASDARTLAAHAATVHVVGGRGDDVAVPRVEQHPGERASELVLDDQQGVVGLRLEGDTSRVLPVAGVFVSAPTVPRSQLVAGLVELDADGGVVVGEHGETSRPGLHAVGDVRAGAVGGVAGALRDAEAVADVLGATTAVPLHPSAP